MNVGIDEDSFIWNIAMSNTQAVVDAYVGPVHAVSSAFGQLCEGKDLCTLEK